MLHDPIADMFIRIRNALMTHKANVVIPASKVKAAVAAVLREGGFIGDVQHKPGTPGANLEIALRYNGKDPAISHLKRFSRPGLRRYASATRLPRPLSGHGLVIVSTSRGIMSGAQAQKAGLGGEVIATVW